MKELKEQLQRCQDWLKEEPNDKEVIEKAEELKAKIKSMEDEKEQLEMLERIQVLDKEIKKLKREINSNMPILKGFEKECYALRQVDNSLKAFQIKEINEKITEFNELATEYEKRFL